MKIGELERVPSMSDKSSFTFDADQANMNLDIQEAFDHSLNSVALSTFLAQVKEICDSDFEDNQHQDALQLEGLTKKPSVRYGSYILGAITITGIALVDVKSRRSVLSAGHCYSACVAFSLGKIKRQTSVVRTEGAQTFKERFHLVQKGSDDMLIVKIKIGSSLKTNKTLATFIVMLAELLSIRSSVRHFTEEVESVSNHATGTLRFDVQFRHSERNFQKQNTSLLSTESGWWMPSP